MKSKDSYQALCLVAVLFVFKGERTGNRGTCVEVVGGRWFATARSCFSGKNVGKSRVAGV